MYCSVEKCTFVGFNIHAHFREKHAETRNSDQTKYVRHLKQCQQIFEDPERLTRARQIRDSDSDSDSESEETFNTEVDQKLYNLFE